MFHGVMWLVSQLFTVCCVGCCDWSVSCLQCVVWGAVIGQSAVYSVMCGVLWLVMQSAVYSVLCGALWLVSHLFTVCCVGCCDWSVSCLQCVVWGAVIGQSAAYHGLLLIRFHVLEVLVQSTDPALQLVVLLQDVPLLKHETSDVQFSTLHVICYYQHWPSGYLYSIFSRVLYSIDANDVKGISKSLLMFCLCNVIVGTQGQPLIIKDQSKVSSNEVKYTLVPQFNSTQIHMRSSMTVPCQSPICTMYMY